MGCNIDHSVEDVKDKLNQQREHLPEKMYDDLNSFLADSVTQDELNEIFHLLKKYDLASSDERAERNRSIVKVIGA
ncbi:MULTISPECIES: group-specific protein [Bacillaceae]|uniref:Group-specific protein n=1 Tax=Evansella alkalicola TaxID=745819 RepID=A0ABS6JWF8_9BACI|nr:MULTISPECIES: group-specific protein [Bacillaceae]MBU9721455.1 group-specific protein [Bacillus alkalicola]